MPPPLKEQPDSGAVVEMASNYRVNVSRNRPIDHVLVEKCVQLELAYSLDEIRLGRKALVVCEPRSETHHDASADKRLACASCYQGYLHGSPFRDAKTLGGHRRTCIECIPGQVLKLVYGSLRRYLRIDEGIDISTINEIQAFNLDKDDDISHIREEFKKKAEEILGPLRRKRKQHKAQTPSMPGPLVILFPM